MWKLVASVLSLAAVGGPVTFTLAATDAAIDARAADEVHVDRQALALETTRLAARGDAAERTDATERRRERRSRRAEGRARVPAALEAIAACESGGNPSAVGGGGAYRGKYQFSRETWASVGGEGDPADAPESEQDRRAATLYAREGAGHWPVCGRS
jgi:hypothetical protein